MTTTTGWKFAMQNEATVRKYARRLAAPTSIEESDAVQEVLIAVASRFGEYDAGASGASTWIYWVARRVVTEMLRDRRMTGAPKAHHGYEDRAVIVGEAPDDGGAWTYVVPVAANDPGRLAQARVDLDRVWPLLSAVEREAAEARALGLAEKEACAGVKRPNARLYRAARRLAAYAEAAAEG